MEKQLKKLKNKSVIVIILALLALTWQFLNYLTIKEYIPFNNVSTYEIVILYSSYLFFIILFLALISLTFTSFRVSLKYYSEKKKIEKEQKKIESQKNEETIREK